jgi:hypothetical protein
MQHTVLIEPISLSNKEQTTKHTTPLTEDKNEMKKGILILLVTIGIGGKTLAQNTLIDRDGTASFFSEAPLEDIEAINKEVLGAIDLEKGTIAVSMLIRGFHFDKSLMEEHFNENYLESEKYPKATFKGVISNFTELDFKTVGKFVAEAKGEIEIHGVKKPLNTIVKFDVSPTKLSAITSFDIAIKEFNIDVPRLVVKNIAEVVEVKAMFDFIKP